MAVEVDALMVDAPDCVFVEWPDFVALESVRPVVDGPYASAVDLVFPCLVSSS